VRFDHLELREVLTAGQQIDGYAILCDGRVLATGQTVGVRRWQVIEPVSASELTIRLDAPGELAAVTAFAV